MATSSDGPDDLNNSNNNTLTSIKEALGGSTPNVIMTPFLNTPNPPHVTDAFAHSVQASLQLVHHLAQCGQPLLLVRRTGLFSTLAPVGRLAGLVVRMETLEQQHVLRILQSRQGLLHSLPAIRGS